VQSETGAAEDPALAFELSNCGWPTTRARV